MSAFSKAIKSVTHNPGSVIKKAVKTGVAGGVGVVTGFATGGVPGAIAGGVSASANAAIQESKTHKGPSNSKLLSNAAGVGAIAGGATGVLRALTSAVPTGGVGTGGLNKALTSAGQNKFGLVGNVFKNIGGFAAQGLVAGAALFKNSGAVPGTNETPDSATDDQTQVAQKIRSGFNRIKSIPAVSQAITDTTQNIRDKALGSAKRSAGKYGDKLANQAAQALGQPIVIGQPSPASAPVIVGGGENGISTPILLAGAGVLAAFLIFKKK